MTETNEESPKIRHDWYQTESQVILTILCKNVKNEELDVKYQPESIGISFCLENGCKHTLSFNLLHEINIDECYSKASQSKVEIKLKKKKGVWWKTLEKDVSTSDGVKEADEVTCSSSSAKEKNWDKVVDEIINKEDNKLSGDEALQALFQKIYSEGSDEVRKAMNKSFVESSGTVLSTNWSDIKNQKVNIKTPDGMEWKKWD